MSEPTAPLAGHTSTAHAVRHHLGWVIICLVLGALGGWYYSTSAPATFTSTARVLVNPTSGNPFVPTPSSVRQDELTSLETEAQVMRSTEVLGDVVASHPEWTVGQLQKGLSVIVPPNTQILEITYSSNDRVKAQAVTQAVAETYLANRAQRFTDLNAERIARVEARTLVVVTDLRAATEAAQQGSDAEKLFQSQMAEALRNELISLRAQRTALDNNEAPAGTVIAPASVGASAGGLTTMIIPVGGALAGLAFGCLVALLLERSRGKIRSEHDVEVRGLPVIASVPARNLFAKLRRRSLVGAVDTTVRRVRATLLDLEPRPDVIAVVPTGSGAAGAPEAIAHSFAKAGHSVVLVRADLGHTDGGLGIEERDGLAQLLMYERLNVLELLQPTVEPLLSVLPDGGFTAQSRELLVADRLRSVVSPLIEAGHLVVVQSAGIDSPEGEAAVGACDMSIVVVTQGRTRPRAVEAAVKLRGRTGAALVALVVGAHSFRHRPVRVAEDHDEDSAAMQQVKSKKRARTLR